MIPTNFDYHKAQSVDDAIAQLGAHGDNAKILAGGHSLIPAMKLRLNTPGVLIDIARLSDLRFIRKDGDTIAIGAASTHHDIASSELIGGSIPMLASGAAKIGDIQVRNLGTIGGSIAHADPAADWPALLLAANASVCLKSSSSNREITAADFFQGFYMTALEANEIITEIRVPVPAAGTQTGYEKFYQPASRFAIVGCAAMVKSGYSGVEDITIAFTGVADCAFRDTNVENALKGKALTAENIAEAAEQAAKGVDFLSDHFASAEYRHHLAKVYVKRVLSGMTS